MNAGMKTPIVLLIATAITGCSSNCQRFVPMPHGDNDPPFVLDTKTGQYCVGSPKQASVFPLCHDLYIGKIK